jgi:hypothetical protein
LKWQTGLTVFADEVSVLEADLSPEYLFVGSNFGDFLLD